MPLYALLLATLLPLALLLLGGPLYLIWARLQVERLPVQGHPSDLALAHQDVAFPARGERLLLRGWYLPAARDSRCLVLVQGEEHHRNSPGIQPLRLARDLTARGYSVLLFDLRARGESQGRRPTAGDRERRDLLGALDYVQSRGIPPERIGVLGFSLGAAVALLVAAQEPRLRAVVSDSAFADLIEDLRRELWPGHLLPTFAVLALSLVSRVAFGADLGAVRPIQIAPSLASRAVLFIHGAADEVVSSLDSQRLAAATPDSELWLVEGAGHVRSYAARSQEYVERVAAFFDRHLERS